MNYSDTTGTVLYGHDIMPAELWNIEPENFRNSSSYFQVKIPLYFST